jgi:cytochrome P450
MQHTQQPTPLPSGAERAPVPAHVPASLVVDFDGYRPMKEATFYHAPYAALQTKVPDIFWSPYNGGHWILTRRDHLAEAFADPARFTSSQGASVDKVPAPGDPKLAPIELDPPEQQTFRRLFAPAFTVTALKEREKEARALAIELIEEMKPKGRCEFVTGFAQHLPIKIFMKMVDLPEEDRLTLLPLANAQVAADAPKEEKLALLFEYAGKRVAERAARPGDDLISRIATAEIDGRPITMHEAVGVTTLLLIGGLDTVASMMGHVMHFLAGSPEHRRQLAEDPSISSAAAEEFLRRFALTNPGRTVVADMEFHGVAMRAGDKVLLATPFGAVDPRDYPDPLRVDFQRKSNSKTTFGAGPHVCPGSMLARIELKILLEEWLPRLPDFQLDPHDPPRFRTGVNGSVERLPLVWAP